MNMRENVALVIKYVCCFQTSLGRHELLRGVTCQSAEKRRQNSDFPVSPVGRILLLFCDNWGREEGTTKAAFSNAILTAIFVAGRLLLRTHTVEIKPAHQL